MANRAYLYPHSSPVFERFESGLPERYYDSRHTIPIGWFFFFRASDVVSVNVQHWEELKLVAPMGAALSLFRSRRSLLNRYLVGLPSLDSAATILNHLDRWSGEYLLMDPVEIVDDDVLHKRQFELIFQSLESSQPKLIDAAVQLYYGQLSADPESRLRQVLGYTYWP